MNCFIPSQRTTAIATLLPVTLELVHVLGTYGLLIDPTSFLETEERDKQVVENINAQTVTQGTVESGGGLDAVLKAVCPSSSSRCHGRPSSGTQPATIASA